MHKIALRPGKPLMFGAGDRMRALGLPGNPVSAYVCAVLFLRPILSRLQGEDAPLMATRPARLGTAMPANDTRMDFVRARLRFEDGQAIAHPLTNQDSSMLSALASADCLLIRPAHAPEAKVGDPCEIIPLNA